VAPQPARSRRPRFPMPAWPACLLPPASPACLLPPASPASPPWPACPARLLARGRPPQCALSRWLPPTCSSSWSVRCSQWRCSQPEAVPPPLVPGLPLVPVSPLARPAPL